MKADQEPSGEGKSAPISSFGVLGARLTWTALGPLALVATIWGVASARKGWLTRQDVANTMPLDQLRAALSAKRQRFRKG